MGANSIYFGFKFRVLHRRRLQNKGKEKRYRYLFILIKFLIWGFIQLKMTFLSTIKTTNSNKCSPIIWIKKKKTLSEIHFYLFYSSVEIFLDSLPQWDINPASVDIHDFIGAQVQIKSQLQLQMLFSFIVSCRLVSLNNIYKGTSVVEVEF